MLLVSFLLVIVATIFLLSGLFLTRDLPLIFVSIGCSALAGLMLVIAVLRSRPKPVPEAEGLGAADTVAADRAALAATPSAEARSPQAGRSTERTFPIDDYDSLEVVEVLPLLGDLDPAGLEMVRRREASGRAHPWVLARIDALLESEAETGEVEWAPADEEPEPARSEWSERAAEWSEERSEWAASDFPLEDAGDRGFSEIEVMRDFPIDRYDELRANEILPLLSNLDAEDLKMVREEEAAGKARTSILSRIDVLLAREQGGRPAARRAASPSSQAALSLPIADYDRLTVPQITSQLGSLSAEELKAVRDYEQRHKARTGVLSRIETALHRAR